VIDTAHDGDNVTHGHEHVHLTENSMDSHVMRALNQLAHIATAHFFAQTCRLLDGRLGVDEPQHWWHHVQPNSQFQQEAQIQCNQL